MPRLYSGCLFLLLSLIAVSAFAQSSAEDVALANRLFGKGASELYNGENLDAIHYFDQAEKTGVIDARVLYLRGVAKYKQGNVASALKDFEKAAAIEYSYPPGLYSIDETLTRIQGEVRLEIESARKIAREAWQEEEESRRLRLYGVSENEDHFAYYRNSGLVTENERPAIDLESLFGKGSHALFNGENNEAITFFNSAEANGSLDPRCYFLRGVAKFRLGKTDGANDDFIKASILEEWTRESKLFDIDYSLQRVQGIEREKIENFRKLVRERWKSEDQRESLLALIGPIPQPEKPLVKARPKKPPVIELASGGYFGAKEIDPFGGARNVVVTVDDVDDIEQKALEKLAKTKRQLDSERVIQTIRSVRVTKEPEPKEGEPTKTDENIFDPDSEFEGFDFGESSGSGEKIDSSGGFDFGIKKPDSGSSGSGNTKFTDDGDFDFGDDDDFGNDTQSTQSENEDEHPFGSDDSSDDDDFGNPFDF